MATKCSKRDPRNPDEFCLERSFPLRAGVLLISEIGLVSFTLAASLLIYTLRKAYKLKYRRAGDPDSKLQPISVLFLCAIFLDVIQGISNILSVKWAFQGEITEGSYCTAQAVMKQLGNDGVAWFTIAIAVLTYLQVFHNELLGERGAKKFMAVSIFVIALFLLLMISIPASSRHPYYGDTGLWCWILNERHNGPLRIASEYAWMWFAVIVAIVAYGRIAYKWRRDASNNFDDPVMKRNAIAMGWYPIVYFIVVAPQSVIRFLQFRASGHRPGHGWTILTSAIFSSSGALNVILWLWTGRRFGFKGTTSQEEPTSPRDVEMTAYPAPHVGVNASGAYHHTVTTPT
ncbi:uncharacterized protein EI90DRAFT_465085 [Cantharellus anzutake]|uniref:uncharacterized protein n=1 Tax=Cantharellus anzutake TaxID=1750568 RepID=UPI001906333E|nr:uncharacterized protein EI90DRAFT_465085 [Cantharellus anzutake]KAF8314363.1 hypothetical protein EI90DRAFT_465085 [Cantharellus anzutake]